MEYWFLGVFLDQRIFFTKMVLLYCGEMLLDEETLLFLGMSNTGPATFP